MVIPFLILTQTFYAKMKQIKENQKCNFSPIPDVDNNPFLINTHEKNYFLFVSDGSWNVHGKNKGIRALLCPTNQYVT